MKHVLCLLALVLAAPAAADAPKRAKRTVASIGAVQELAPFSPEQLAERRAEFGDDDEAIAADAELNAWKLCVTGALVRWAPLGEGPGTLIDGAYGLCSENERRYRDFLVKLTHEGRSIIDPQMARQLTVNLKDIWRPRLVAAALDQKLAARAPAQGPALPR